MAAALPVTQDLAVTLPWVDAGTALLLEVLDATDLEAPTRLAGWTGRHLAAHLAANARALQRLVRWGATGEETPMYPSVEARAAEIEELSTSPEPVLRAAVRDGAAALRADLGALPAERWTATVRTARGRPVPVREVGFMRVREVWLHPLDLLPGGRPALTTADVPAEVLRAVVDDALALAADRPDGQGAAAVAAGLDLPTAAAWLTGRPGPAPLPALPPPPAYL